MKQNQKPGPVRHIDPSTLRRSPGLEIRGVADSHKQEAISCCGNKLIFEDGTEVSDHDLTRILRENAKKPTKDRMTPRDAFSIVRLRKQLSQKGPGSFNIRQLRSYYFLIAKAEDIL